MDFPVLRRATSHASVGIGAKVSGTTSGIRCLVCVDGGRAAERAVHEMLCLLRHERRDALFLLCAHQEAKEVSRALVPQNVLEGFESELLRHDINYELVPCEVPTTKSLSAGIADAAKELNVDFIVLGTKGLTALTTVSDMLGSVAYAVMERAHCPIAIVKSVGVVSPADEPRVFAAAVDGSDLSAQALAQVLVLARPQDTVLALYVRTMRDTDASVQAVLDRLEAMLGGKSGRGKRQAVALEPHSGAEAVGQTLVKAVDERDIDYLAVASHGIGQPNSHFGSVGQWLLLHARCHIVIVKSFHRIKSMSSSVGVSRLAFRWLRRTRSRRPTPTTPSTPSS